MPTEEPIACVLVVQPDGERVYEPASDYKANPRPGTFIIRERPTFPEPIVATGYVYRLQRISK